MRPITAQSNQALSCRKTYEVNFNVNISDLDKHYDDQDHLNYKIDGNICTTDGNCFPLSITVVDEVSGGFYPHPRNRYDEYPVQIKKSLEFKWKWCLR